MSRAGGCRSTAGWRRQARAASSALQFVAGVIAGLRRLRPHYDLIHTHQGLWEAVATGLGRRWLAGAPTLVQPASSGYYGEADELLRTRGAALLRRAILRNTAFAAISADIERQWRAPGGGAGTSGPDGERRRCRALPSRPEPWRKYARGRGWPWSSAPSACCLHGPAPSPEESRHAPRRLARRRAPDRGELDHRRTWTDRARLAARAAALGLATHIQFAGAVADPAPILRAADAFVLPSVAEGMSNSLLEAMSTALPCLASRIGGNIDLIDDGRTGLLLPADTADAWSSALIGVLEDPGFARRLGGAARERIEAEFALPVVVDRYVALYRRILAGTWPPTRRGWRI